MHENQRFWKGQRMTKEEWRQREHKKIAVEKFGDAVVLFNKYRYLASFYFIGYIFEMGTQYELKRLGDIRLVDETALAVVRLLAADAIMFYWQKKFPRGDITFHQQENLRAEDIYGFSHSHAERGNAGSRRSASMSTPDAERLGGIPTQSVGTRNHVG